MFRFILFCFSLSAQLQILIPFLSFCSNHNEKIVFFFSQSGEYECLLMDEFDQFIQKLEKRMQGMSYICLPSVKINC